MSAHGRRWHGPPLTSRAVSELDEEVVPGRPREFIQSLQRGLDIIRAFGPHAPIQTVSELATTTGLTRATARRFLITLIELGYVETDGRTFRLTPRVLRSAVSNGPITAQRRPSPSRMTRSMSSTEATPSRTRQ